MTLTSARPLNKISVATIAGLVTALILWALRKYGGVEMDTEGATLITSLVSVLASSLAGYLTPLSENEVVQIVKADDADRIYPKPPIEPVKP